MKDDTPIACSLGADQLERRLTAIAEVGAAGLIARGTDGSRHTLRFRASDETRRRLKEIVAAEAECCAFLDLSLVEVGDELVLWIAAPERAEKVAGGLAEAFERGANGLSALNG